MPQGVRFEPSQRRRVISQHINGNFHLFLNVPSSVLSSQKRCKRIDAMPTFKSASSKAGNV